MSYTLKILQFTEVRQNFSKFAPMVAQVVVIVGQQFIFAPFQQFSRIMVFVSELSTGRCKQIVLVYYLNNHKDFDSFHEMLPPTSRYERRDC